MARRKLAVKSVLDIPEQVFLMTPIHNNPLTYQQIRDCAAEGVRVASERTLETPNAVMESFESTLPQFNRLSLYCEAFDAFTRGYCAKKDLDYSRFYDWYITGVVFPMR